MTTFKIVCTNTTKEPKLSHALATSSAFNLKLCSISENITDIDSKIY